MKKLLSPVDHADRYRAYSRAMRILTTLAYLPGADLKLQSRVMHYLYEEGHKHWIALLEMPIETFFHAFDASRPKGAQ